MAKHKTRPLRKEELQAALRKHRSNDLSKLNARAKKDANVILAVGGAFGVGALLYFLLKDKKV